MFIEELHLDVNYEKCGLKSPEKAPIFTGYILKNYDEYCKDRKRPAVIICPGGGYFPEEGIFIPLTGRRLLWPQNFWRRG